jgi:hypothetical protein
LRRVLALAALAVPFQLPGCAPHPQSGERIYFSYDSPSESVGGGELYLVRKGHVPRPTLERLRVFSARPRANDFLAPSAAQAAGLFEEVSVQARLRVPKGVPAYTVSPGRIELPRARLQLGHVGPHSRRLYGIPTRNGWACFVLVTGEFGADCTQELDHGLDLHVVNEDGFGGVPVYLWGVASDDIVHIEVDVGGRFRKARLARNGFTYTLPSADIRAKAIRALVVTRRSGTIERLPLDWSEVSP